LHEPWSTIGGKNLNQGVAVADETPTEIQKWCDHFGIPFDSDGMERQTRT
jgi:hypothetical protein